jgi:hypothetical protein
MKRFSKFFGSIIASILVLSLFMGTTTIENSVVQQVTFEEQIVSQIIERSDIPQNSITQS